MKEYDYWLIIWTIKENGDVHQPVSFQKGITPNGYCEEVMKIGGSYKSYKLHRLIIAE